MDRDGDFADDSGASWLEGDGLGGEGGEEDLSSVVCGGGGGMVGHLVCFLFLFLENKISASSISMME